MFSDSFSLTHSAAFIQSLASGYGRTLNIASIATASVYHFLFTVFATAARLGRIAFHIFQERKFGIKENC